MPFVGGTQAERGGVAFAKPARAIRRRRLSRARATARVVLAFGLALLGEVAYQQWGTGVATARAQAALEAQLRRGYTAEPRLGEPVGTISIARLGLEVAFVEGIGEGDLSLGPGHYPQTPLPGEGGNVAIAGHRTTHLAPFWSLDTLQPGDDIEVRTAAGAFVYRVEWARVTRPGAVWVLASTKTPSLTLTTCNPRFRGTQRLIVRAAQIYGPTPSGFVDRRARGIGAGSEWFVAPPG